MASSCLCGTPKPEGGSEGCRSSFKMLYTRNKKEFGPPSTATSYCSGTLWTRVGRLKQLTRMLFKVAKMKQYGLSQSDIKT